MRFFGSSVRYPESDHSSAILSHKTLRGPRAGLIFFKKDSQQAPDLEKRVNDAVFPACQGGPHNNVRLVPDLKTVI